MELGIKTLSVVAILGAPWVRTTVDTGATWFWFTGLKVKYGVEVAIKHLENECFRSAPRHQLPGMSAGPSVAQKLTRP